MRSLIIVVAVVLAVAVSVAAQSGRKQKRAEQQPQVQGVNQPEARTVPEATAAAEQPKEKEKDAGPALLLGTDMPDMGVPLYYVDIVRQACAREFREVKRSLELHEANRMTRGEAIDAAKKEDRTYVVYLELQVDRMGGSLGGFDLRYTIFEPKTAKIAGTGSGYPADRSRGQLPPIAASRTEYYLELAARDVAHQVLKRLRLTT